MQESFTSKPTRSSLQLPSASLIAKIGAPIFFGPLIILIYSLNRGVPFAEFMIEFGHVLLFISGVIWILIIVFALYISAPLLILASPRINVWLINLKIDTLLQPGVDKDTVHHICPGFFIGLLVVAALIWISEGFIIFLWYITSVFIVLILFLVMLYITDALREKLNKIVKRTERPVSLLVTNFFMILYTIFLLMIVSAAINQMVESKLFALVASEGIATFLLPLLSFVILFLITFGLSKLQAANAVISLAAVLIGAIFVYPGPFKLIDNVFQWFRIGGGLQVVLYVEPKVACLLQDELKSFDACTSIDKESAALEMKPMSLIFLSSDRFYLLSSSHVQEDRVTTTVIRREDVRVVKILDGIS